MTAAGAVPPGCAQVRTQVAVPLRFADGYATTAVATTFTGLADGREHLALALGTPAGVPLVRPHSQCLTGDVFGSARCDCGPQLRRAQARVARDGGVVVYLRGHEGRGVGLAVKIAAYAVQDTGIDTVAAQEQLGLPVDARDYSAA